MIRLKCRIVAKKSLFDLTKKYIYIYIYIFDSITILFGPF